MWLGLDSTIEIFPYSHQRQQILFLVLRCQYLGLSPHLLTNTPVKLRVLRIYLRRALSLKP